MNERIKELVEQAMVSISYRVCQNTFKEIEDPTGPFVRKEFDKEKFAELIVRECVEVMRLVPYDTDREFGDEIIYQDAVKKHFGVKE